MTAPVPRGAIFEPHSPPELVLGPSGSAEMWISSRQLYELLRAGRTSTGGVSDPPFARPESRVGLALAADQRLAKRAMLYFQRRVRMGAPGWSRAGLASWITAPAGAESDVARIRGRPLRIGRRNPALSVDPSPAPADDAWECIQAGRHLQEVTDERLPDGVTAWMILASPVALDHPDHGVPDQPVIDVPGPVTIEVRTSILGHPTYFGGLDLAGRRGPTPRPVRAYLRPGASWRIRLHGGSPSARRDALCSLHHACTLGDPDARTFGFGRTWIALPEETR